jgi:hypothetical protein
MNNQNKTNTVNGTVKTVDAAHPSRPGVAGPILSKVEPTKGTNKTAEGAHHTKISKDALKKPAPAAADQGTVPPPTAARGNDEVKR